VGAAFLEAMEHIGVSRFVSFGNRIDVDESDLLAYLADDPRTDVIAVYCEGFRSGAKFARTARTVTPKKPVVIYKSARTDEAAAAAVSHTGFYGGSYEVALGAFRQAGVIPVDSIEELVAATKALACLPVAGGNRVAMVTNGAGTAVQAVDILADYGLRLATLSPGTAADLRQAYPEFYQVGSIVDVTGSATTRDYMTGIERLAADPGVDLVLPWFVLQDTPLEDTFTEALVGLARRLHKPVVCGAAGGLYTQRTRTILEKQGMPLYGSVREWVAAAMSLAARGEVMRRC
jgi:3-hydroxypropionyl-CoA synthetase (ADP-forming)